MYYYENGMVRAIGASAILHMSEGAFRAAVSRGKLPHSFKFGGSRVWKAIDMTSIARCMGLTVDQGYSIDKDELTAMDMSEITQLSVSSVWRKVKSGDIPEPVAHNKRIYYWERATVMQWLNKMGCVSDHHTYLTYQDVADMAGVTVPTVHQAVSNRKLREPCGLTNSLKAFKLSDVERFLHLIKGHGDII